MATAQVMSLASAACYLTAGVAALVTATVSTNDAHIGWVRLISVGALVFGVAEVIAGGRIPRWFHHFTVNQGTILISVAVWLQRDQADVVAYASLLVFASLFTFFFFSWPAGLLWEGSVVVAILLAHFWWHALSLSVAVTLIAVNVLIAGIVGWLVRAAADAAIDALTGLPNRRGLDAALQAELARAERTDEPLAVAFLDLDHFKTVNDTRGHAAGDRLLHATGRNWSERAGAHAVLARFGGDEFALLLPGHTVGTATMLIESFRTVPGGHEFSAGVAVLQPDDTASMLVSRADTALYEAKRSGRNRTYADVAAGSRSREMADALAAGEFAVAYQPIVDLGTGLVTGAEALLRWTRPGGVPVPPDEFIPLAESSGFIVDLGRWVLETSCREAASWPRSVPFKITVNVAGRELQQVDYYDGVVEVLGSTGLPIGRLVLEVTESTLDADADISTATLARLRALGIQIAIDDFGTGYSSLSRLDRLPVDFLKIDRAFVLPIGSAADSAPLVAAITALAQALGMRTVAEGVEHDYQAAVLERHGCQEAQGWHFGRPGDPSIVRDALAAQALPAALAGSAQLAT